MLRDFKTDVIMLKKTIFTIFFIFLFITLSNSVFSNSINYEISTDLPVKDPYYVGTLVKDLSISFVDSSNILIKEDYNSLKVKLGLEEYLFLKEKDNKYHLRNFYIQSNFIINNRFAIDIKTPTEGYSNTKKSYAIRDISNNLILKNNPELQFSKLTVNEKIQLYLEFESIKDISNMTCFISYNNSKSNLNCNRTVCSINFLVPEELKEINFICNYDKTVDDVKTKYPFILTINPELSKGIYIKEIINPEDRVIKNPFEVCFNIYYKSNRLLKDYYEIDLFVNNVSTNFYDKGNNYCFTKFLFPFSNLDLDLVLLFDDSEYYFEYDEKLKPGLFWIILFIIVIGFIIINIILIIRSITSKEDLNSLVDKRDAYQTRLKLVKDKYLQGNLDKREFEKSLQEYTIKISWLNEQILRLRKEDKFKAPKFVPKTQDSKQAPQELLNALNTNENIYDNKELFVEETDVNVNAKPTFYSKIKDWFKNLKEKLNKPKQEKKKKENKDLEDIFAKKDLDNLDKNVDLDLKINSNENDLENEFDIRKWQK